MAETTSKIEEALEAIADAVDVNDGDTLARLLRDDRVIWTASGSWTGSRSITLGHLRAVAAPILAERRRKARERLGVPPEDAEQ